MKANRYILSAVVCVMFLSLRGSAESCGCFCPVHVNPWITLLAIDIPAVITLIVLRPALRRKIAEKNRRI
jgi:hypothetical protein